jgi:cholesterol oxidase
MPQNLASSTGELKEEYATVVIGSGYGGSITAARLAERGLPVCLLERGREWHPGDFPDTLRGLAGSVRSKKRPLGYVDYYFCKDIDVLKGSGLGGTSLINANVALRPDPELFDDISWPKLYRDLAASGEIWKYYQRAEEMLRVRPHPNALQLTKVQMIGKRALQLTDDKFWPVPIAVNFDVDGPNHVGVPQKPCINCNDCITGCNVGAKNTLYMNYIPYARQKGAEIFTQIEVLWVEKSDGWYTVHYRYNRADQFGEPRQLRARNVVLSGGTLGSTEILLRSVEHGLTASQHLGEGFSGNGDYLSLAYNNDDRTNVMGYGDHPGSPRAQVQPGPNIVSAIQYHRSEPVRRRFTIQDFTTFPSGLVDFFRYTLPGLAAVTGTDMDSGLREKLGEIGRVKDDLVGWNPEGAVNHSMVYLGMAIDNAQGKIKLDGKGHLAVDWPSLRTDPIYKTVDDELREHARTLGGTYVHLGRFNPWTHNDNLVTAHPMGGCHLGEDADSGVVDVDGRVFDGQGGVHQGLYVVDGAIVPMSLAVNPLITISALAERIAERMIPAVAG